jgi:hypothetical protein
MTTKARCEKLAQELNVEIYTEKLGSYLNYDLEAPKGIKFGSTDCHACTGEADTMKEIWQGVWGDLQSVSPCTEPKCENC